MAKRRNTGILEEARFSVLRVLNHALTPVGLREIAYRTNLSIASVQAATRSLLRSGHIAKSAAPPRVMFAKKPHREWLALEVMFRAMSGQLSQSVAVNDPKDALRALEDMFAFSKRLKGATVESR